MKLPALLPTDLARVSETLLIALVGGALFSWAGMPAGLISGSVVATAVAALVGRPMYVPQTLTRVIMVVVGVALGSVVTPATLRGLAEYPLSITLLCLAIVGIIAATTSYLHFVHRWDRLSAMLGASPGALAQTIVMAAEMGVDLRGIVVVQTMRILFLTLGIPSALALFGFASSAERGFPAGPMAPPLELLILIATAGFCAIALYRLKFPGGWIFGSMMGSGFLHGTGLIEGHMPWWLTTIALTSIGAVTGARFTNTPLRLMLSYLAAGIGSFTVAMTVASCFAVLAAQLVTVPFGDIVMAYSPGAQDTMMVLALALHLDPVFVGAHHLARYLIVSLGNPFLARLLREPPPEAAPEPGPKRAGD
jgi:membrane AbrB-like protein